MRARGRTGQASGRPGPGQGRSFQVRGMEGRGLLPACLLVLLRVINVMYHFYIWAR